MKLCEKILVCGYGNIGKHLVSELNIFENLQIYDIKYKEYSNMPRENFDYCFVCVPTDSKADGSCDTSIVEEIVKSISSNVFIIKSTIPVGTTDYLKSKYNKNVVFSPEYYGTTQHSPKNPNFLILGGETVYCSSVAQLYYKFKSSDFTIKFTDSRTAELVKYMENCFLAMKVTFCSEFSTIAKEFNISYPELRELFIMDERMGHSHTYVIDEQPYYDSHCLNKDIPALIKQTNKEHLMESVYMINLMKKNNKSY